MAAGQNLRLSLPLTLISVWTIFASLSDRTLPLKNKGPFSEDPCVLAERLPNSGNVLSRQEALTIRVLAKPDVVIFSY